MELKNAVAVCLISLFSATLVVLIARSLDLQAASRLEGQLARIIEELEAIRASGAAAMSPGGTAKGQSLRDGLVVYYFHSNTRCATCQAIESQAHETVQNDFAAQLSAGEIVWKTLNYEEPAASELTKTFDILMPVVVLARMEEGKIMEWNRLDQVWGLVDDGPAFAEYIRSEIDVMLETPGQEPALAQSADSPSIPVPEADPSELPLPTGPADLPLPE